MDGDSFDGLRVSAVNSRESSPVQHRTALRDKSLNSSTWTASTADLVDRVMRSFEERTRNVLKTPVSKDRSLMLDGLETPLSRSFRSSVRGSPTVERSASLPKFQRSRPRPPQLHSKLIADTTSSDIENSNLRHRISSLQLELERLKIDAREHRDGMELYKRKLEELESEKRQLSTSNDTMQREILAQRRRLETFELANSTAESVEGLQAMLHRTLAEKAQLYQELEDVSANYSMWLGAGDGMVNGYVEKLVAFPCRFEALR